MNLLEQMMEQLMRSMGIPAHLAGGPMTEEQAFWRAIGENPQDQLPRLVFADWLEERGRWAEGRALRETADRVPKVDGEFLTHNGVKYWFFMSRAYRKDDSEALSIAVDVYDRMTGESLPSDEMTHAWRDYHTAEEAIRDLCRGWVVVHGGQAD